MGVQLSDATRAALVAAGETIRAASPHWRGEKWVAAENLHVTLVFLGDIPADQIDPISTAIADELAALRAFKLPFARLRPAPNARRTSMLWAAYDDPNGEGCELASAIGRAANDCGIAVEDRRFKGHVTLARARRPRHVDEQTLTALSAAQTTIPPFVSVPSATLFSSTLTQAGPHYQALGTWEFPT